MSAARSTRRILIRRATPEDAEAISGVLRQAFAEYQPLYTPPAFRATTPSPDGVLARLDEGPVWVALRGPALVGTASVVVAARGCSVRGMAVAPAARGRRIGWRLLETIEQFAQAERLPRLYLCTTPFLDRAIALYERYGFRSTDDGPPDLFGTPLFTMAKTLDALNP
jgi:putative acetyltransferase